MRRAIFLAQLFFTLTLLSFAYISHAYTSPGKPQGFVNDYAKVISTPVLSELKSILSNYNSSTTVQIAVVTINSLGNETVESYAVKLFEEWKIGVGGKNNGVLLLISIADKEIKIEVGYGLEGVLTDSQSNRIIQNIILPEFKKGDYSSGILSGTKAIISVIDGGTNYSPGTVVNQVNTKAENGKWDFIFKYGFFVFIFVASVLGSTKSWWLGGVAGGIIGIIIGIIYGSIITGLLAIVGLTVLGLLLDFIVSKNAGKGGPGGSFWGGFGGTGGGGFGGGGFGGFGGGSSGGGGASGRW
jgi:uncharacterized protein